jgi:hypothetical protein
VVIGVHDVVYHGNLLGTVGSCLNTRLLVLRKRQSHVNAFFEVDREEMVPQAAA